jgi:hypothetical protein
MVTIKDIPVDYLLKQNDDFFTSDKFNNGVALFDSLKTNTPLLTEAPTVPDDLINSFLIKQLLDYYDGHRAFLTTKLLDYYESGFFNYYSQEDQTKLLYINLQKQLAVPKEDVVQHLAMDTSTLDFDLNKKIFAERIFRDSTSLQLDDAFGAQSAAVDTSSLPIYPPTTSNKILDLVKNIKFLKQSPPNVFNKDAFLSSSLNAFIRNVVIENTTNLKSGLFSNVIATKPVNNFVDNSDIIDLLKTLLLDRYDSTSKNNPSDVSNFIPSFRNVISDLLASITQEKYDFFFYEFDKSSPSNTWTVSHKQGKNPVALIVFPNGSSIDYSIVTYTIEYVDHDNLNIHIGSSIAGKAYLLFDKKNTFTTIKEYWKSTLDPKISVAILDNISIMNLFIEDSSDGFVYEYYNSDGILTAIQPVVTMTDKKLTFTFAGNLTGELYVMPVNRFVAQQAALTITVNNIKTLLANFDFINKRYNSWQI